MHAVMVTTAAISATDMTMNALKPAVDMQMPSCWWDRMTGRSKKAGWRPVSDAGNCDGCKWWD